MSITKAFRVLAVVLVASFVPATALAETPRAGAPGAEAVQTARTAKGRGIKIVKANKATKAGKANKAGKSGRVKIVRHKPR